MNTLKNILFICACILITPAIIIVAFILLLYLILIFAFAAIWWIFALVTGTPIKVMKDGKRIGRFIKGKYFPD